VFVAVIGWQSWLAHANVRLRYGPLRYVLVSPEFHHWHHSTEREARNRNYAGLLAFWDVLFGTVHLPRGGRPLHYGLDERVPAGYVNRLFHPFRRNPRLRGPLADSKIPYGGHAELDAARPQSNGLACEPGTLRTSIPPKNGRFAASCTPSCSTPGQTMVRSSSSRSSRGWACP
jgi:hypothetical protein